ncbi:MAG: hypothetical protein ACRDSS_00540 [Actinocrinis sp.]
MSANSTKANGMNGAVDDIANETTANDQTVAEAETETAVETESGAETATVDPDAADGAGRNRFSRGVLILAVLALVAGALGSVAYNHRHGAAPAGSATIVRSAADRSTYVTPGDFTAMTVPVRNDSTLPITVISLAVSDAPRIKWDGVHTVVQPGATADLRVNAPSQCAAMPHPLRREFATSVTVILKIANAGGTSHGSLRALISGVLQYAVDLCSLPSAGEN